MVTKLLIFSYNKEDIKTIVKIDLSDYVSCRVLYQLSDNKLLHPVIFFSINLNPAKYNYKIYNKKLLGIITYFKQ